MKIRFALSAVAIALSLAWAAPASAHCDTLDGPVVEAARTALDKGDVRLVLGWVRESDEPEVQEAFARAAAVRTRGAEAKALADTYFFETLVRMHRAGEGAPYTGLKPAGEIEPPILAADKALATGKLQPVGTLLSQRIEAGLHDKFEAAASRGKRNPTDVAASRAYVAAYVDYVHYVERIYDAAGAAPDQHATDAVHQH
ncbi:MAG TPA: DUF6448 family protein [Casimicrobiaceae bacterium]|nr:DUF6448 family protein [Casimicrobiaceae bacterium]